MQGTNVLFGQIAVVFGIVIAGVWSATQWTAAALGYQLRLGSPWFDLLGTPIYHPWKLFEWWFFFDAYAPRVFDTGGAIAGGSGLVAVLVAIGMSIWRSRQSRLVTTYGTARWANAQDIRKAGLTQPTGVFLGQHDRQYLRHEGPEHVLTFAPTRSGKGVGLVVPTLLSWPTSAVIHDIKGENWQITAGWRSRFSHCLLFNPTDATSAAYNPLLEVRRGANEVRDVQNIADILVDPEGALEKRNHWEKTSHALLVGAILHVLYAGEDKTLRGVANFLSDPACPFELTLHRMMTTPHLGDGPHPVVASAAREVLNKSDNERSGVLSTAMSFLGLYRDPTVAEVTSRCDWRIADLIAAEHPVSLYLVVPPSDISRTKPLIRLILNQIGRRLTESLDGSDGIERRHKLLLMLDEFPALGRLDFFETALAFMAGYGIRSFLIAQSLNQIDKAYGQNHSILDNCHVRVTFATNDERTAKRISETLGTATELRAQRNYAGHRLAPWLGHLMVSRQETAPRAAAHAPGRGVHDRSGAFLDAPAPGSRRGGRGARPRGAGSHQGLGHGSPRRYRHDPCRLRLGRAAAPGATDSRSGREPAACADRRGGQRGDPHCRARAQAPHREHRPRRRLRRRGLPIGGRFGGRDGHAVSRATARFRCRARCGDFPIPSLNPSGELP
ncbi:TRAG family protein [[Acidovorax] ebreus TPSY]|uniref:TRAG family protein n=1 Tax=Acidovorax ebreus (strain TPSY) TaxID=535289 RepID=A0A9J9QDT4_ACIET|nr:TRAG family protein [[Acidovorax] ebreus TPSY]